MNRGGRNRIARRLLAAFAMLGLGVAVVGGGVAFADDTAGSGTPASTVPGIVTNYRVNTPSLIPVPIGPGAVIGQPGGGLMATADEYDWT
jgi:hypothetical protein